VPDWWIKAYAGCE